MEYTLQKLSFFIVCVFLHSPAVSGDDDFDSIISDLTNDERVELFTSLKCPTAVQLFHHLTAAVNRHDSLPG